MEKLGEVKSAKIVKDIYTLAAEQSPDEEKRYSAQFLNILKQEKIPIHPTFIMERVDKYRDENGKSTIHLAVEAALKTNNTATLE